MIRRRGEKRRARKPAKLSPELREYLAFIGGRGGQKSRRLLSRSHAKEMVAIREAKRRAAREGNLEFALKRIPLSHYKPSPLYRAEPRPKSIRIFRVPRA